jgi:Trypsin-like peptidase domain
MAGEEVDQRLDASMARLRWWFARGSEGTTLGALEGASSERRGAPDDRDRRAIALQLRAARGASPPPVAVLTPVRGAPDEVDMLAASLVQRAAQLLARLGDGASTSSASDEELTAFEAVVRTRGRPALRVENNIEAIDDRKHPESGLWRTFLNMHEARVLKAASATGAIMARDRSSNEPAQVRGTAWLVGPDQVLTNRHVLFPPSGMLLASRRSDEPTRARIRTNIEVVIDFAYDNGLSRKMIYEIEDIPFVAQEADPLDVAVLRVRAAAIDESPPVPLAISSDAAPPQYVYVLGHPGPVPKVPEDIMAVFGSPDGRKRVSVGRVLEIVDATDGVLWHDASTVGGYSGGCVLEFGKTGVAALHYHGHPVHGNRAFKAAALHAHPASRLWRE